MLAGLNALKDQVLGITAFQVKLAAVVLMVVDHLGIVLSLGWMRLVGRFSFPLFAWLLVQGAKHTQDWNRYQTRLLYLACLSQPIYMWFSHRWLLNTVFLLWIGLQLIKRYEARETGQFKPLLIGTLLIAAYFADYGLYGLALIYLLYVFPCLEVDGEEKLAQWFWFMGLNSSDKDFIQRSGLSYCISCSTFGDPTNQETGASGKVGLLFLSIAISCVRVSKICGADFMTVNFQMSEVLALGQSGRDSTSDPSNRLRKRADLETV